MPTTKERILVTLTPSMAKEIKAIAKESRTPKATVAARLLKQGLDDEEDRRLSRIADRLMKNPGPLIGHDEFWRRVKEEREKRG